MSLRELRSANLARIEAFRKGCASSATSRVKTLSSSGDFAEEKWTRYQLLRPSWCVSRLTLLSRSVRRRPRAAKEATNTIPIVMAHVSDPIAAGFVASLARPGGNITGLSIMLLS